MRRFIKRRRTTKAEASMATSDASELGYPSPSTNPTSSSAPIQGKIHIQVPGFLFMFVFMANNSIGIISTRTISLND
jgi:hypothetical protein